MRLHESSWFGVVLFVLLSAGLGACGGGSTGDNDNNNCDGGSCVNNNCDGGACDNNNTTDITVTVTGTTPYSVDAATELEGAVVRLDEPGGLPREGVTDANGVVVFEDVVWSGGTAGVTAYLEGYTMVSRLGLTQDDTDVAIWLQGRGLEQSVVLSGDVAGRRYSDSEIMLSAGSYLYPQVSLPFSIDAPKDQAFVLVALEYDPWGGAVPVCGSSANLIAGKSMAMPALSADATAQIDLSDPDPVYSASATILLPNHPDCQICVCPSAELRVSSNEGGGMATYGMHRRMLHNAAHNAYTFDASWIEPPGIAAPVTGFFFTKDRVTSNFFVAGYPQQGATYGPIVDPPRMVFPTANSDPQPFFNPIEFHIQGDVELAVLFIAAGPQNFPWAVIFPADYTAVAFPQPPSTADLIEVLGTEPLLGIVQTLGNHPDLPFNGGGAQGERFELLPP